MSTIQLNPLNLFYGTSEVPYCQNLITQYQLDEEDETNILENLFEYEIETIKSSVNILISFIFNKIIEKKIQELDDLNLFDLNWLNELEEDLKDGCHLNSICSSLNLLESFEAMDKTLFNNKEIFTIKQILNKNN